LAMALTIEMPAPGDYKAMEVMGLPLLLTRGRDGKARAFFNVCKHRAMQLVEPGRGNCKGFACPYHGWTYGVDGKLVAIAEASTFGDVDKATLGLTELPCEEVAGLIFAILTPGLAIDVPAFLGGMLEDLAALRLETWYFHKSRPLPGANWKIAYDGYLEGYHFQAAHPETVTPRTPSNRAWYDAFGPHIRLAYPQHRITELRDLPRDEWGRRENLNYDFVRMLFPNFAMFSAPEMCQVAQLFPGKDVESNITLMNYIFPKQPESAEELARLDEMCDFFYKVVEEEDYLMNFRVQRGLKAGASETVNFGRNEPGNQLFHHYLAYYLGGASTPAPQLRG
ncbi:MAG TPA: SRPBCC family protein, partial [Novosphingobium sp.]|nr:SRPBCC family protein [Novosphingobium sp.]